MAWWLAATVILGSGGQTDRAAAQQALSSELEVVQLRPNFYLIAGAGGNIVVQIGPIGVILVDSGSTDMSDKVLATIRQITPLPIRYIINTSMDADHVGGNGRCRTR
jgi:glyoxylase-like metal-dependent hydrolase (beta-lactamase superfamily II)